MKKVCIFNQKGGVGKTTTNINLCAYLVMEGYKVLTIDIDPQGNTTTGLGIDKTKLDFSIYDVLTSDIKIQDVICRSQLIENLHVIPSTIHLAKAEIEIINKQNSESILLNKLKEIEMDYDYIFIDCPPSLGILTLNALVAIHSVLIPMQSEFYALEGVNQVVNTIQLIKNSLNKKINIEGIIMTMHDSRTNLSNEIYDEVKEFFESKVYETTIPRNIKLAEAPSFGLPIMLHDYKCKGAITYKALAKEFLLKEAR